MALRFLRGGYFAGSVGIGTQTPSANLDIEDASGVTIDINSSTGDGQFRFQDNGVTKWAVGRDNTQQNFVFSNSTGLSSDNVLILAHSTGNVGIGTDSPGSLLSLRKDDSTLYDPSSDDGQRAVGATILLNNNDTTTNTFGQIMYDTDSSGQGVARIVFLDAGTASSAIAFVTEQSDSIGERMRIASDGAIKFNTYGAGTLVSDASGNITVSSGGGAGGPYLPLAGGTMTGVVRKEYSSEPWSFVEATHRPLSIETYSEAGSIGTTGNSAYTDVYGEADLSGINNNATFTYLAAWQAVEVHKARLPTLAELWDGVGAGSGQSYDDKLLWTCTSAGPHHVFVALGALHSTSKVFGTDYKIVDINDSSEVYRTRAFFDVSRNGRSVNYSHDGTLDTVSINTVGTITATTFLGDLGATSTINTAVTGTTQTAGNNSTLIATTAYADAAAGAVPIGNYLPLAGGTMTGTITSTRTNNTSKISFLDVKRGSGAGLYLKFQTDSTAANNVSQFVIRRSTDNADILSIAATSGNTTFIGDVTLTSGVLSISGDGSNAATLTESSAGILTIAAVDDIILDAEGDITLDANGGDIRLKDGGTNFGTFTKSGDNFHITSNQEDAYIKFFGNDGGTSVTALTLNMADGGDATFAGTVSSPTFLGDLNGTINTVTTAVTKPNTTDDNTVATTAFVKNLIAELPAGLIYKGTWNADTNTPTLAAGGGEISEGTTTTVTADKLIDSAATFTTDGVAVGDRVRVENVNGVSYALVTSVDSQTQLTLDADIVVSTTEVYIIETPAFLEEGNYYIVSVDGATDLNGITDWKVGDWVVASSTNEWQKIDNSSVLDGQGTGQTIPLWSGSGDSNTLGNSLITQSGDVITIGSSSVSQLALNSIANNDSVIYFKQVDVNKAKIGYDHSEDALAFIHGSGAFSTAGMVLDGTGVGIGTTSPLYKLDVDGQVKIQSTNYEMLYLHQADANGGFIKFTNTDDTDGWYTGIAGTEKFIISRTADNSVPIITVEQNGNVGIGDESPIAKLHVSGNSTLATQGTVLRVENTADVGSSQDIHIYNQYDRDIGIKFETLGGTNNIWQDSNSDDALIFTAGGIARATDSTLILEQDHTASFPLGSLGVGLTNPDRKLHVKDGAIVVSEFEGTNTGSLIDLVNSNATQTYNGLRFTQGTTSKMAITHIADGTTKGYIQIGNGWATGSEILVVDGRTSNVGIGTTSPDAKLEIIDTSNPDATSGSVIIEGRRDGSPNVLTLRAKDASAPADALPNGQGPVLRFQGFDGTDFENMAYIQVAADGQAVADGDAPSFMAFGTSADGSSSPAERMRITNLGGISFGSTGTAYGSSGQVLTSAGDASPTWETPTTGTVTGTGAVNQVAFWDGTNSLDGTDNLYWDSTNNHLGIGDATPGSRLKVASGVSDTSVYTVDVNHVRNDADVSTIAMRLNVDLSGADTTTTDRTNSGLFIDLDSSADGDASNEHRIRGVNSDVRFTGFSDSVQSGYFLAESNNTTQKTALLMGLQAQASHDSSSINGGVSNMYGVYGVASIQDLGDVDNAYGGLFMTNVTSTRGAANVGITKGVEGKVTIDKAETITYGEMTAVSGIIDNNETTFPTFVNQYLFKGDYQGTKGGNAYGIYTEGDKHYFDGNIGIRSSNPTSKLTVGENGITTKTATATIADTTAGASLTLRGGSPTIYFDRTGADPENKILMDSAGLEFKTGTLDAEGDVDFKINPDGSLNLANANLSNQENTDIDSAAAEVVAQVAISYTAAFFDFVVKKGTNVRSGTVYACHDGTNVEFTETSTNDLGDTSDVTLSVDKTSTNLRLLATVTSDDWSVKSLIRAI
jgi:hypothetical protein